ncbi:uncharacterized protein UV8b_00424 [Ustilaginoidea virens]|uniref:Protein-S-isoprenylcysteine O-methyltransferase n=1 Tax=Ustilaginoidea virens TaxID=1159556 RepID=A0A8E5HIT3_USTVR|nr:uncharacterized protein UV8b_00424 [Ustilaginoidea virens]QUC16183.1 hypothetical protein UV8b_00424 [Ustilaginoidea virens]
MGSLSAASFALVVILSGYFASLSLTPPNVNPAAHQAWGQDSIRLLIQPGPIMVVRLLVLGIALHHAAVALMLHTKGAGRAPDDGVNHRLFKWTGFTSFSLFLMLCVGTPLRLSAFGALGSRFTFGLAQPNELNTSGIYHYIQHPSYTGFLLIMIPYLLLFVRWDGSVVYWLPRRVRRSLDGWGFVGYVAGFAVIALGAALRVSEEETMLKESFGHKWETWNRNTKRFIPGVF